MKLAELEPRFLKITKADHWCCTDSVAGADGIIFLCPKCFVANRGSIGTHSVICWRPHVPQSQLPGPGRWEFKGTNAANVTLFAGSSSIYLKGPGCGAHFFVENGEVRNAESGSKW
ncbi:MAG: hypothetical protein ACRDQZ_25540 [Mycobacteriales bacterium]